MSMDDGYRKMVTKLGQRTDKFEAGVNEWAGLTPIMRGDTEDDGWVTAYHTIAKGVADTVAAKNESYGDSFAKSEQFLKLLYPNGVTVDNYSTMLSVVRIWDKLMRIATNRDAFGENPFADVAGYALLAMHCAQKSNPKKEVA